MVYYDPDDLGWKPYVQSWMQKVGHRYKEETRVSELHDTSFNMNLFRHGVNFVNLE